MATTARGHHYLLDADPPDLASMTLANAQSLDQMAETIEALGDLLANAGSQPSRQLCKTADQVLGGSFTPITWAADAALGDANPGVIPLSGDAATLTLTVAGLYSCQAWLDLSQPSAGGRTYLAWDLNGTTVAAQNGPSANAAGGDTSGTRSIVLRAAAGATLRLRALQTDGSGATFRGNSGAANPRCRLSIVRIGS